MVTLNYNGQELDFTSDELARAISHDYNCLDKLFYTKDDLYRHLCDICETSYHEPVDKLLENLKKQKIGTTTITEVEVLKYVMNGVRVILLLGHGH